MDMQVDIDPSDMRADLDASNDLVDDLPSKTCQGQACAYTPLASHEIDPATLDRSVPYEDITGQMRTIKFQVRRPVMPQTPVPVVIWSHGGSSGKNNPDQVGTEWGEVFNRAGYVSVHIAHAGRTDAQITAQCTEIGLQNCDTTCTDNAQCTTYPNGACNDNVCRYYKPINWDRPHDLEAVLAWLAKENAPDGVFKGRLDLENIAYAGHSAGAGSAMMAAGASRLYGDLTKHKLVPQIKAFIACSPQGPGEDGFSIASYDGSQCPSTTNPELCLTRPVLLATGAGDDTGDAATGSVAENRKTVFEHLPAGQKYLFYINDESARHGTFEHNTKGCSTYARNNGIDQARCSTYLTWLDSVVLAFLDANLKDHPPAKAYLASDHPKGFDPTIEWQRK